MPDDTRTDDTRVDVRIRADEEPALLRSLWDGRERFASAATHLLGIEASRLETAQADEGLRSIGEVEERITLLEHQLDAAHRALFGMDGGALFADEVGLGKTIEVGIVLKEMAVRGTHRSVLLLTPAQLATQWREELRSKFGLAFASPIDGDFAGVEAHDRIVASIDTAKSERFRGTVTDRFWDVVVLDEAHYVRNDDTDRWALLDDLSYEYAFFATATPVQNDLTDLYNVVDLLRPGALGTETEFEERYVAEEGTGEVTNAARLQRELGEVMIRHEREDTDIDFTHRRIETNTLAPTDAERALYDAVTDYVRTNYAEEGARHLVLLTLQKEVVSSPQAVLGTVEGWLAGDDERRAGEPDADDPITGDRSDEGNERGEGDGRRGEGERGERSKGVENRSLTAGERKELTEIERLANAIEETTKGRYLREIVIRATETVEKGRVIVFTQFRATQRAIVRSVEALDVPVHVVNGGFSSAKKDEIVRAFEAEGGVLVTTDSISEGRNLQFCNLLVNYDLPWNPMSVEQRIGRIDRIGQDREVFVFNLALEGTVEEYVLEKLYGKLDLFAQTVGDLKDVLSTAERSGTDFENEVFRRLVNADDRRDVENDFESMAVDVERNRVAAEKLQDFNGSVFESFEFGSDGPGTGRRVNNGADARAERRASGEREDP
jgi:SNF2 family DNA or RNA helicase